MMAKCSFLPFSPLLFTYYYYLRSLFPSFLGPGLFASFYFLSCAGGLWKIAVVGFRSLSLTSTSLLSFFSRDSSAHPSSQAGEMDGKRRREGGRPGERSHLFVCGKRPNYELLTVMLRPPAPGKACIITMIIPTTKGKEKRFPC